MCSKRYYHNYRLRGKNNRYRITMNAHNYNFIP